MKQLEFVRSIDHTDFEEKVVQAIEEWKELGFTLEDIKVIDEVNYYYAVLVFVKEEPTDTAQLDRLFGRGENDTTNKV
jgi:hypothetical protein